MFTFFVGLGGLGGTFIESHKYHKNRIDFVSNKKVLPFTQIPGFPKTNGKKNFCWLKLFLIISSWTQREPNFWTSQREICCLHARKASGSKFKQSKNNFGFRFHPYEVNFVNCILNKLLTILIIDDTDLAWHGSRFGTISLINYQIINNQINFSVACLCE